MGILSSILERLGITHAAAATPTASSSPAAPPAAQGPAPAAAAPKPESVVDVVAQLETRAKAHAEKLNWRTSIVDLLKLLDLDSSLETRKQLAQELGCPKELIGGDYSKMNMWLHEAVLARIAANGGNVPTDLLKGRKAA